MTALAPHTPAETSVAFCATDGSWTIGTYTGNHEPQPYNNLTAYEVRVPDRTVWVIGGTLIN